MEEIYQVLELHVLQIRHALAINAVQLHEMSITNIYITVKTSILL